MEPIEALFRAEYRRLVGIARLLVDDPAQAEEVVQDAFVQLHRQSSLWVVRMSRTIVLISWAASARSL